MVSYGDTTRARQLANAVAARSNDPSSTVAVELIPLTLAGVGNLGDIVVQKWLLNNLNPALPIHSQISSFPNCYLFGKFKRAETGAEFKLEYRDTNGIPTLVQYLNGNNFSNDMTMLCNEYSINNQYINFSGYVLLFKE